MKKVVVYLLSVLMVAGSVMVNPVQATSMLEVDCDQVIREVTHCASGSLYGITEDTPGDIQNLVAPLSPYVMRNPARATPGSQHNFGDALIVSARLESVPGAKVSIDLADMLPYWPYQWPGMSSWLSQVDAFITDKKATGRDNFYGYEIWNEPYGTWKDSNGSFHDMWKQTFNLIRTKDPTEKIIGPCFSYYNGNRMRDFLTYCKANNCIPDIMSWHELGGAPATIPNNIKSYRALERELGISELPLSINEYCDSNHDLEGQPGSSARFIGKFERYKVESACITWWFVPKPGRLGSLMATDTQRGAGWYFYKWYGDMSGNMVGVTPPNDNSNLVDGAACVDTDNEYVSFIFGGPNDGAINTTIKNLPEFIGDTAHVKVERIDWVSKDTVSYGPTTINESNYSVTNDQIMVSLNNCNDSSGYRIYVTPGTPGEIPDDGIISGNTYKLVNRNSQKVLDVNNASTNNGASVFQWSDNGSDNQKWQIIATGSSYKLMNVRSGKALDVEEGSTENGADVIQWSDNGGNNQRWYLVPLNNGYYHLVNVNSGKLLDVDHGYNTDGANVLQWSDNGGANQEWQIIPVS